MINVSSEYMNLIYEDTTKTKVDVRYGVFDVTAKETATASSTEKQTFSDEAQTLDGVSDLRRYTTLERNQWVLNDAVNEFPMDTSTRQWGWWSLTQSNDNGTFTSNPKLTYTWSENRTSVGLVIKFWEPVIQFKVNWYNSSNTRISTYTYDNENLNENEYTVENGVENYRKIEIEVTRTLPNHYAKIASIQFGIVYIWDDELVSIDIEENVSNTSQELISNKAVITRNNINDDFNKYNPNNKLRFLQEGQQLEINAHTLINGQYETVPLGIYYLTSWGNPTRYQAEFVTNDLLYKLDGTYYHGKMYTNATVETIITDVLSDYNLYNIDGEAQFTISDAIKNVTLSGYIPICTYREALQYICFSIGAVCKADRYGKLNFYRITDNEAVETIGYDKKQFSNDNEDVKYGAVSVTQYNYEVGSTTEVLFKDTITGNQTITFDSPASNITITGTHTSFTAYANCVDIVGASGEITVSGKPYNIYEKQVKKVKENITLGITYQTLNVDGVYLIANDTTSAYVTNWLLSEVDKNISQEFKWLGNPAIEIGDYVNVEVAPNSYKKAIITKNKFKYDGALMEESKVVL